MMTRVNSAIRGRKHVSYDCSDNTTDDAVVIVDHEGCEWCNGGASGMSQDALPRESQRHGSGDLLSISRPPDLHSLAAPIASAIPALATLRCSLQDNSWNIHTPSGYREYQTSY